MRKLTDDNLAQIVGSSIQGYHIEAAKIKNGPFADSDHYGVLLGKNSRDMYVTWEFHLREDGSVSAYWGHYIQDREEALRDFKTRGVETPQKFHVTVTEIFQLTIAIEADSKEKAEQVVSADWRKGEFALGPECFAGVEFEAVPVDGQRQQGEMNCLT